MTINRNWGWGGLFMATKLLTQFRHAFSFCFVDMMSTSSHKIISHLPDPACENSLRLNVMNLTLRQNDNNNTGMIYYNLICSEEKIRGIPQGDRIWFEDANPHTILSCDVALNLGPHR